MTRFANPLELHMPSGQQTCLRVEFFGLPGSGKTTIAREVYNILARAQPGLVFAPDMLDDEAGAKVRVLTKLGLVLSDVGYGGAGFGAALQAFVVRQQSIRDKLRATFTLATVTALYAKLQRRRMGAVLDQGVIQALWSIQFRAAQGSGGALTARFLKDAASSGRIHVSVETPPELCIKRLATRASKHSRMQVANTAADDRTWEVAELLRRTLISNLRAAYRKQGIPPWIVTVDGTAEPSDAARQIAAVILRFRADHVLPQPAHAGGVIA